MGSRKEDISRESAEYAEILAEVFAESLAKSADRALCSDKVHNDITASLMECLQYVYLHGPSPIREIANGLEVSLSAASQLVDRLVRKNLVVRRENESDRRLTSIELTETGRVAAQDVRRSKSDWFRSILSAMPDCEREAFRDGLEGFLKIALAHDEKVERACVRCGMEHVPFCVVNRVKSERDGS